MRSIFFAIIWLFSYSAFSQSNAPEGIQWMTWQEAMEAREKFIIENKALLDAKKIYPKKIFIDMYTDWCGWCKKMDATTFKDPNVVKYMNQYYWAVKMDAEMSDTIIYDNHQFVNPNPSAKRSTHTLAASLLDNKLSYPTYVIMDENVSRSSIFPGYKNVGDLMGILVFFGSNNYLHYKGYLEKMYKQQLPKQ
jgi:thioredoxin-related protein